MISNNTFRVSGLASGMNTDEIVANMVQAQSARLNKMLQSKTTATWKSDAYRDINTKVDEFRKAMEGLRLQSPFNKQTVSSSDARLVASMGGTTTQTSFVISGASLATSAKPAMVSFNSNMESGSTPIGITGEEIKFKLENSTNTAEITLTGDMTFDQAIAKINESSSTTNIKAANVGGSLVLTSTETGDSQSIKIQMISTGTNNLNITNIDTENLNGATNGRDGTDGNPGSVTINDTTIAISSNKFTYEGVSYNLKEDIPAGSNVGVSVGSDSEGIFDNIKTFVDKYNELIADLNSKISEKRYRDFPPLLDEQKKDMKENDIKLWEEKAKSGVLSNDSTIQSFLTEMRNSLSTMVENPAVTGFNSLNSIGINFSKNYRDHGKLEIDEDKLKGLLKTNLEDIKQLFTSKGTGAESDSTTVTDSNMHKDSGFGWRIYDRLNTTITQLGSLAGSPRSTVDTQSNIAKQIKALDSNIQREQQKISAFEARQWRQFTAMEKALAQLNSQGSWLSQQLGM